MFLYNKFHDIKFKIKMAWQRVKYGYDDTAIWDTDLWFIETMSKILEQHKNQRQCFLRDVDTGKELSEEDGNAVFNSMIYLLKYSNADILLEEWYPDYNYQLDDLKRASTIAEENKNEFFELFSKYFYQLWN